MAPARSSSTIRRRWRASRAFACVLVLTACGGDPVQEIKKSQHGRVMQAIAEAKVTIVYNRPVARGRTLFGPDGIVKYGEPWNPGADQATAIELTRGVLVQGHELAAGDYSVWAIPGADEWTMIFSTAADVFHTPYPGEEKDALRFSVRPQRGEHMETLAFYFPVVDGRDAVLRLHWGETVIPISIRAR